MEGTWNLELGTGNLENDNANVCKMITEELNHMHLIEYYRNFTEFHFSSVFLEKLLTLCFLSYVISEKLFCNLIKIN